MNPTCDSLYTADWLITQNEGRDIIHEAALAVAGDRILCVGHAEMLQILYPEARRVDLGEAVILPGLINAHTHVSMSLLRGYSDDKALRDWLQKDIFPREAQLTPELVELGARLSMAEMIRYGTTAFYDMYMLEDAVFRAADAMGLRAVLGESTTQFFPSLAAKDFSGYETRVRRYAEEWKDHPRIRQAIVPHAPYTTSPDMLHTCRELADETGSLFGMHLAETKWETEECMRVYGKRPVEYCAQLGLLQPDSTFFHLVDLSEDDIHTLAEARCAGVHNPASNMKLASGVAPLQTLLRAGVPMGLGTDGAASNNAQNMLREIYLASLLQKVHSLDPAACPAQTALDLATRGGAAALHDPYIGSLEPGMKADFIALDLTLPHMQPLHNLVSQVVYAANGSEVCLNVVNGIELFRDGQFLNFDYNALRNELRQVRAWIRKS